MTILNVLKELKHGQKTKGNQENYIYSYIYSYVYIVIYNIVVKIKIKKHNTCQAR